MKKKKNPIRVGTLKPDIAFGEIKRSESQIVIQGRQRLLFRIEKRIEEKGFNTDYVNSKSFFELENDLSIGHRNLSGISKRRRGYIPLSPHSQERLENNIRYVLKK